MKRTLVLIALSVAAIISVRYSHSAETKILKIGEIWNVTLPADPANRYQWNATGFSQDLIDASSSTSGAVTVFSIKAKKTGRTNLIFEFRLKNSQQNPSQVQEYILRIS